MKDHQIVTTRVIHKTPNIKVIKKIETKPIIYKEVQITTTKITTTDNQKPNIVKEKISYQNNIKNNSTPKTIILKTTKNCEKPLLIINNNSKTQQNLKKNETIPKFKPKIIENKIPQNPQVTKTKIINTDTPKQNKFFNGFKNIFKTSNTNNDSTKSNENNNLLNTKNIKVTTQKENEALIHKKTGSTEKTTEVQVKKTFKDGKWVEEKTETVTITNPKGNATTKSQKISYRDLEPNEVTPTAVELPDKVSIESPRASRPATTSKTVTAPIKISRPVRKDQKDDLESFSRQVLSAVNVHRKTHGAPALHISAKLTKMAKEWAEKLAKLEKIEHGGNKNIGENIYCKTSSEPFFEVKVEEVVQNWYSEVEDHSYDEEPKAGYIKTGHFTQLVWRETTEMGISYARNKNGHMAFVVAYFSPKGNWIGEFKKQVLPSGSELPAKKLTSTAQKYGFKTTPTMAEENFYEDFLRTHNNYRNKHGVKPLRYNEKLSKFAQEWAENNARRGKMEHRRENEYGENIYKKWSTKPNHKVSGEEAVHSWYEEINQYEFGKEPLDLSAGHFTQMIWSDSEELGVGIASSKTGENVFVVANYNPPGNYIGQFSQKVPSPK